MIGTLSGVKEVDKRSCSRGFLKRAWDRDERDLTAE